MTLIFKRYTGGVGGHSLAEDKDKLAGAFNDICGKGLTNSVRWWVSGLVNLCDWRASDYRAGVASIRDMRDGLVQIESVKIAFDNQFQLVTGRVAELYVKSSQKAIESLA